MQYLNKCCNSISHEHEDTCGNGKYSVPEFLSKIKGLWALIYWQLTFEWKVHRLYGLVEMQLEGEVLLAAMWVHSMVMNASKMDEHVVECMEEGYLAKITHGKGAKEIKVGEVIAIIVEDKADIENLKISHPSHHMLVPPTNPLHLPHTQRRCS
ncbi:hypothetical protein L1887_36508 [Cichorium endivia]|nr:hypothetical protein L1887_36508 [Cichorium endivia]